MQDNELLRPKEKAPRPNLLRIAKLIITGLILAYIYKTFRNEQKGIADIGHVLYSLLHIDNLPVILATLILVPVNWALESLKWQTLAGKIGRITFKEAFRGTLTGLAVGVAMPAQLGDTVGRIATLKTTNRLEAIGAALLSNGIQFMISVIGGSIGWFQLHDRLNLTLQTQNLISGLLILILALAVIFTIFRKPLTSWHPKRRMFQKLHHYIRVIGTYSNAELLWSLWFGGLRYLVFLSQFVLVVSLFSFSVPVMQLFAAVTLVFLVKTLIPAINVLGDLGLREFTALVVFSSYQLPPEKIIAATFLVWILNVLGPILVGIFLIWKYKWREIKW